MLVGGAVALALALTQTVDGAVHDDRARPTPGDTLMRTTRALLSRSPSLPRSAPVGCTKHQTEMILVITTEGVRIPDDVHKVHLTVADRAAVARRHRLRRRTSSCATDTLTTSCYDIPVTRGALPRQDRARTDSVRVQVDAIGGNGIVIADAALFTFAEEQSLRLDFVLYANCLGNVDCAAARSGVRPARHLHRPAARGRSTAPLDLALPIPRTCRCRCRPT